jgi:hypothetical protein
VPAGGTIDACWTAPSASPSDWIVLHVVGTSNNQYYTYQYTGGAVSGCLPFGAPPRGTYEFRYLVNGSYTDVVTSNEVAVDNPPSLLYAHEWKFRVTADPQNHPRFDVGALKSTRSYVPRQPVDQQPGNPAIGEYLAGFVHLPELLSGSGFSSNPKPKFSVLNGSSGDDGVQLSAAQSGRSISMSCLADPALYGNDGFKTAEVPVPVLDCPAGPDSTVTVVDTTPVATVSGQLECIAYLPEPSRALAFAIGGTAMLAISLRRRRRDRL